MIRTGISTLALMLRSLAATPAVAQTKKPASTALTAADADAFVAKTEKELADFSVPANQVGWVNATYITDDTDAMAARVNAQQTELQVKRGAAKRRSSTRSRDSRPTRGASSTCCATPSPCRRRPGRVRPTRWRRW